MKDTLFHIDWGDHDTTFVIAPDEATARERMGDGKDMVNYVVKLDHLYSRIFKAGIKKVVKWVERSSNNWQATTFNDQVDGKEPYPMMTLEMKTARWQAKSREWGIK